MSAERVSLREFARQIGVGEKAVRNAVGSGRLRASVGRDDRGRPFICDLAVAVGEWSANAGQVSRAASGRASQDAGEGTQAPALVVVPVATLNDAQRLATMERVRKLRIENDVAEGRLVLVEQAANEAFEAARTIREAILNLPARLSGELAAESDPARVHLRIDAALREALASASDRLLATVNE